MKRTIHRDPGNALPLKKNKHQAEYLLRAGIADFRARSRDQAPFSLSSLISSINPEIFISAAELRGLWRVKLARLGPENAALRLYVNIPFCPTRCSYCLYRSETAASPAELRPYMARLKAELGYFSAVFGPRRFSSLYIGGGCPLYPETSELDGLFKCLTGNYRFGPDAEKCIETNPRDLTREKIALAARYGFSRLSMGIQSLDPALAKQMNRGYQDYTALKEHFRLLRALRLKTNVDLMFGFKADTAGKVLASFRKVLALKPDHIALYPLLPKKDYLEKYFRGSLSLFLKEITRKAGALLGKLTPPAAKSGYSCPDRIVINDRSVSFCRSRPEARNSYFGGGENPTAAFGCNAESSLGQSMRAVNAARPFDAFAPESEVYRCCVPGPLDPAREYLFERFARAEPADRGEFLRRFRSGPEELFPGAFAALSGLGLLDRNGDSFRLKTREPREVYICALFFWNGAMLKNLLRRPGPEPRARGRYFDRLKAFAASSSA